MLETPLKRCSQKLTFLGALGTGAKAPVPKKLLKVFQNMCLFKFRNILKLLIGKFIDPHSNGCIAEMTWCQAHNLEVPGSIPRDICDHFLNLPK